MKCLSAAELGPRQTKARRRLGHRATSESTAGDLLLVRDEGALLLAHRHALHVLTSTSRGLPQCLSVKEV